MSYIFYVAVGGLVGSVLRYVLDSAVAQFVGRHGLPWGTLLVNIAGCFAIGFLSHFHQNGGIPSPSVRVFAFSGLLGGFTTFSTFANETYIYLADSAGSLGVLNIVFNVGGGLLAVWLGRIAGSLVLG